MTSQTHIGKYTHVHSHTHTYQSPPPLLYCFISNPALTLTLHSEPPVAGLSGRRWSRWPTPLLVCWSGGNITFSALWGPWCWCRIRFSSSCSSCSPGSLPLQQVAVGMKRVQMHHQVILRGWRVAALLTHVQLVAALLVGVRLGDTVDLLHVWLQWAALGEGLLTEGTLVWADPCVGGKKRASHAVGPTSIVKVTRCVSTCMCAYMSLKVKGVIETFSAEAAEVPLCLAVTFEMSVQHSLVVKGFLAHLQTTATLNQRVLQTAVDWINCHGIPGTQTVNFGFGPLIWSPLWHPGERNWSSRQEYAGSPWRWEYVRKGR